MTKLNETRHRNAAMRRMKVLHDAELNKALEALTDTGAPIEAHDVLRCLSGRRRPLRMPHGADLNFREDLARHWVRRIERRLADEPDQHYVAIEIQNESWACPAHHPVVPFLSMRNMAVRPLKRLMPHSAYAPSFRLRQRRGRALELAPSLRFFAILNGPDFDRVERLIATLRHQLDPHGMDAQNFSVVQPIVPKSVARQVAHLLTFGSGSAPSMVGGSPTSEHAKASALIRTVIAATIPIKAIAAANGTMRTDLRLALGQAKAAAVARHGDGPSPIAQTEVYPAIGDLMPMLNGKQPRLPFCLL